MANRNVRGPKKQLAKSCSKLRKHAQKGMSRKKKHAQGLQRFLTEQDLVQEQEGEEQK